MPGHKPFRTLRDQLSQESRDRIVQKAETLRRELSEPDFREIAQDLARRFPNILRRLAE